MVLRFDDLDTDRAELRFIELAQRDLEWLGLDWDGPPVLESSRLPELLAIAESLEARGLAYACVCTRGDLRREHQGAPQGGTDEARYSGTCRGRFLSRAEARQKTGRDAALRFIVDPTIVEFKDRNFGVQRVNVYEEVGDFPIVRRSGIPAYQLAVVVDDALDSVNEVVRGRDLLSSTARQRLIQEALDLRAPDTCHIPLITDRAGKRLAKRDDASSLAELRARGVEAGHVVAWVARMAGQDVETESASAAEVLGVFETQRLGRRDQVVPDAL